MRHMIGANLDAGNLRLRGGGISVHMEEMRKSSAGLVERFQSLHRSIEAKRLELCPWEQFGIECEEAFAYQQVSYRFFYSGSFTD